MTPTSMPPALPGPAAPAAPAAATPVPTGVRLRSCLAAPALVQTVVTRGYRLAYDPSGAY